MIAATVIPCNIVKTIPVLILFVFGMKTACHPSGVRWASVSEQLFVNLTETAFLMNFAKEMCVFHFLPVNQISVQKDIHAKPLEMSQFVSLK
jgi:hypothetical protein